MRSFSIIDAERLVSALHGIGRIEKANAAEGFRHRLARFLISFRKSASEETRWPRIGAFKKLPDLDVRRAEALLQKLHGGLSEAASSGDLIDIWTIAGLGRRETRNAAVLAWLLNPRGSHGQGTLILSGLLSRLAEDRPTWVVDERELDRVVVRTEHQPLGDIQDRIDIALDGPSFILFLELKIRSTESRDQINRYVKAADAKQVAFGKALAHVVYLAPTKPTSLRGDITYLTWGDLADTIFASLRRTKLKPHNRLLIERFARHIARF